MKRVVDEMYVTHYTHTGPDKQNILCTESCAEVHSTSVGWESVLESHSTLTQVLYEWTSSAVSMTTQSHDTNRYNNNVLIFCDKNFLSYF